MKRLLPFAILLAAGCNDAPLVDVGVARCGRAVESWVQREPAVDVLFVIDDSSSMAHEQQRLRDSFDELVGWLANESVSYHLGLTTTSVTTGAGGWLVGTPPYIANDTPDGLARFVENANVGIGGAGVEQGMEAARKLLAIEMTEETGFLRDDAKLAIIFVSDEDDDSKRSIEEYATFYLERKGNDPNLLSIHAVAGEVANECEGVLRAGERYLELVERTSGRFTSICEESFAPALEELATDASGRVHLLGARPDVTTLDVKAGDATLDRSQWSFDPTRNAVVFGTAPEPGTTIEVTYEIACE